MRKLALFICILSAFRLVQPFANFIGTINKISAPSIWLTVTATVASAFFSAVAGVGLLFYFALYRDKGTLHISRRMRFLGSGTALVLAIMPPC